MINVNIYNIVLILFIISFEINFIHAHNGYLSSGIYARIYENKRYYLSKNESSKNKLNNSEHNDFHYKDIKERPRSGDSPLNVLGSYFDKRLTPVFQKTIPLKEPHLNLYGSRMNQTAYLNNYSEKLGMFDDSYIYDGEEYNQLSSHNNFENILTRVPREHNSQEHYVEQRKNRNSHLLTEHKFKSLGTPEAIQKSFLRIRDGEISPAWMAKQHRERMDSEGKCRYPMKRVINISNETSRIYNPRCTILHRCGDDTGCCRYTTEVCTNKTAELVSLHVYVSEGSGVYRTEQINMYNHTECHCINRMLLNGHGIARDKRSNIRHSNSNNRYCLCPSHFSPIMQTGIQSGCLCSCSPNSETCQRLTKGMVEFSISDQLCILKGVCRVPTCQKGAYDTYLGRCPHYQFKEIV